MEENVKHRFSKYWHQRIDRQSHKIKKKKQKKNCFLLNIQIKGTPVKLPWY